MVIVEETFLFSRFSWLVANRRICFNGGVYKDMGEERRRMKG